MSSTHLPTYSALIKQSWPIILANSTVPLLGIVDTAVIGHFGSVQELASLALAALIFSFVYWAFGFLRMGTTGFVARAYGAKQHDALLLVVKQSCLVAMAIGGILIATQMFILWSALQLLAAPESTVSAVETYFSIRIWGAPATLLQFVFTGVFIGLGASKKILLLQLCLNLSNAMFDVFFAAGLGMGIKGIALGTVIAEYMTLVLGLYLLSDHITLSELFRSEKWLTLRQGLGKLMRQNTDILIRTLFLLLGFAFFTRMSASFGEVVLAANHVLLQYVAFCAFFLDGFAYVLESHVGQAQGKRSIKHLKSVLQKVFVLSGITALVLAISVLIFGESVLNYLTDKTAVVQTASEYLPWVALYVLTSVAAYQFDGAFIGAGYSSAMRNCSIASTLVLIGVWYAWFYRYAEIGLWYAFIVYVMARGATLFVYLPELFRRCK